MDDDQVIQEWIEVTEDAIADLRAWLDSLREWQANGGEMGAGDFRAAHRVLSVRGLEMWADECKAGDGLDRLAEVVVGVA